MESVDRSPQRWQYTLRAILCLTALVAVAVTGVRYHLRLTIVAALTAPLLTTTLLFLIAWSSPAKNQALDVRRNPWFRAALYVTVASWIIALSVALWMCRRHG